MRRPHRDGGHVVAQARRLEPPGLHWADNYRTERGLSMTDSEQHPDCRRGGRERGGLTDGLGRKL